MTGPVQFEICSTGGDDRDRGTLRGIDINPADYLQLVDHLMSAGWPIPPEAVIQTHREALVQVIDALKVLVGEVGVGKSSAMIVKTALENYAPDWVIPEQKRPIGALAEEV